MAKKRRKRRRRHSSRLAPVLVALLLIILVGAAGVITSAIRRYTPSDARMDLADYYQQSAEDELSLILQDKISDSKGRIEDGTAYIPYAVVTEDLDGRFYWDQETQQMLYTLPEEILEIQPGEQHLPAGRRNRHRGLSYCAADRRRLLYRSGFPGTVYGDTGNCL